jgi:hypothetical protein
MWCLSWSLWLCPHYTWRGLQVFIKVLSGTGVYVRHAWSSWFLWILCSLRSFDWCLIVTRVSLNAYLCRVSESGHSWQHYQYPFSSKSRWEFPASECWLGYIVIIVTIFLKQLLCPAWCGCGLQVNERRECDNGNSELFSWRSNTKEFLFIIENSEDTLVRFWSEHRMMHTWLHHAVLV